MREIKVNENEAGQRLDKLLTKYMNKAPKSFFYKMLRKKNIVLNDKKATGSEQLVIGDSIKLFLAEETIQNFSEVKVDYVKSQLDVIFEDKHILLLNKSVDILSQKAKATDISLVEHVISYMLEKGELTKEQLVSFRPSISNRLDRNTTGLIVAGKTLVGLQTMAAVFKERSLHKYYHCLVLGKMDKTRQIEGFLSKNEVANKVMIHDKEVSDSLPIKTAYTPIRSNQNATLLEVKLITGRSHQIRAHLASIGHPIIGDFKYGNKKYNQEYQLKYNLTHQLLHSYRLEMPKITGELSYLSEKEFIAPYPALFKKIVDSEIMK
jgi:Pseudouridylate synthases, 23S RNA-specific